MPGYVKARAGVHLYFSFYSFICLAFFIMRIGSSNLLVLYQGWSNACDTLGT